MAVYRQTPTCPFCGKIIAKAVMYTRLPHQPPKYGDDFSHWEYFKHNCKKKPIMSKEDKEKILNILREINERSINKYGNNT